jgi:hypothetical protein
MDRGGRGIEVLCTGKKLSRRRGSVWVRGASGDGGPTPRGIGGAWTRLRIGDPIVSHVMSEVDFSSTAATMDLGSVEDLDGAWVRSRISDPIVNHVMREPASSAQRQ